MISNKHDIVKINKYIRDLLPNNNLKNELLSDSCILLLPGDYDLVLDILWLVPDYIFEKEISNEKGRSFVIDDHKHDPPIFTKIRSKSWLNNDINKRLCIAYWLYSNSNIIVDNSIVFREIIKKTKKRFELGLNNVIRFKYLELRSERHNLRQAVIKNNQHGVYIIKGTIVKLLYELCFLIEGKPYPYKKLLSTNLENLKFGKKANALSDIFLMSDILDVVKCSEDIVQYTIRMLESKKSFNKDFIINWWNYLS